MLIQANIFRRVRCAVVVEEKSLKRASMAVKVVKTGPVYQPMELVGRQTSLNVGLTPIME